jgi:hypothetical protein
MTRLSAMQRLKSSPSDKLPSAVVRKAVIRQCLGGAFEKSMRHGFCPNKLAARKPYLELHPVIRDREHGQVLRERFTSAGFVRGGG